MKRKAIFLDKDGTILNNVPYNVDPRLISFYEGVISGLTLFRNLGFLLIIVSNQSGVAHGYFKEEELIIVKTHIQNLLKKYKLKIDGFYYCPHHPQGVVPEYSMECFCRKPMPGLLINAGKGLDIDFSSSWIIGDTLSDIEAGKKVGTKTMLINNGNETEWVFNKNRFPDFMVDNFKQAADIISFIEENKFLNFNKIKT